MDNFLGCKLSLGPLKNSFSVGEAILSFAASGVFVADFFDVFGVLILVVLERGRSDFVDTSSWIIADGKLFLG